MKKVVTLAIAAFMTLGTIAQEVKITLNPEAKSLSKNSAISYIGSDGQTVYAIMNQSKVNTRLSLEHFDMNYNSLQSVRLDRETSSSLMGGFLNGDHIDLLLCDQDRTHLLVTHERRNATTLAVEGEPSVLVNETFEKGPTMLYHAAMSPNSKLIASVQSIFSEGLNPEMKVTLYNTELEPYWTMTAPLSGLDFIRVTDEGEVIVGGWKYNKDDVLRCVGTGWGTR